MFFTDAPRKCQVVTRISEKNGAARCLKPAPVLLALHTPDPLVVCLDCARKLAIEILDSVPGGKHDVKRVLAERKARR
jgi:hypothetical protein